MQLTERQKKFLRRQAHTLKPVVSAGDKGLSPAVVAEIESALVSHPSVAEAAAIGLPHEVKGNAIYTYVILRQGVEATEELKETLRNHVGHEVGPIAKPQQVKFVDSLPKTRSGKIMRRVLKAEELGIDPGNLSTLDES